MRNERVPAAGYRSACRRPECPAAGLQASHRRNHPTLPARAGESGQPAHGDCLRIPVRRQPILTAVPVTTTTCIRAVTYRNQTVVRTAKADICGKVDRIEFPPFAGDRRFQTRGANARQAGAQRRCGPQRWRRRVMFPPERGVQMFYIALQRSACDRSGFNGWGRRCGDPRLAF